MIKIFRKIRQVLLSKNQVKKYLLYAIGEVVLVVIGILIAVAINGWNEGRKESRKEQALYSKMILDLDKELTLITEAIDEYKTHEDLHYHLFGIKVGTEEFNSEMPYGMLRWSVPFIPTFKDAYQGNLDRIKESAIRDACIEYFRFEQRALNRNAAFEGLKNDIVRPYITTNNLIKVEDVYVEDRYKEVDTRKSINLDALTLKLNTREFDQLLYELKVKTVASIKHLEYLLNANRNLRRVIDASLSTE